MLTVALLVAGASVACIVTALLLTLRRVNAAGQLLALTALFAVTAYLLPRRPRRDRERPRSGPGRLSGAQWRWEPDWHALRTRGRQC